MKPERFIAETLVWLHFLVISLFGFIPFFIPISVWSQRPLWHFLFLFIVMILGLIIATIYRKKFNIKKAHICFLNLITQRLRGYKYSDPKNYTYSHMIEILQKFGINVSPLVSWLALVVGTVLTVINLIIYLS